jgi:hypothetical protein
MESSMHKSVKLVASALATMAVVGGSATAASANSKPVHGKAAVGKPADDKPEDAKAKDAKGKSHGTKNHGTKGHQAKGHQAKDEKPIDGTNVCGANAGGLASAENNGKTTIDDILQTGQTQQVICQVGENNSAVTYNEGDVINGAATIFAVGAVADDLVPDIAVSN